FPVAIVVIAGLVVVLLLVMAGLLHMRDIDGWKQLDIYVRRHLWSSIVAIVLLCCVVLGTGVYFVFRASRPQAVNALPRTRADNALPQGISASTSTRSTEKTAPAVKMNPKVAIASKKAASEELPHASSGAAIAEGGVHGSVRSPAGSADDAPHSTYQQDCKDSACAQGPGAQATFNQFGAQKYKIDGDICGNISTDLAAYKGGKMGAFGVGQEGPGENTWEFHEALQKCFNVAGIQWIDDMTGKPGHAFSNVPTSPGITITYQPGAAKAAVDIKDAIVSAHMVTSDEIRLLPGNGPGNAIGITIGPRR
ncbi:MAG: hypothetical protein ABSG51_18085, partial [Terracidiphilus sp.]